MNRLVRFVGAGGDIAHAAGRLRLPRRWRHARRGFLLALPTLLAIAYFGVWAAPRYVSETQFVVRGANAGRMSGLEALFRTFGMSRAVDDANIVQQYMVSRDAVTALDARTPLRPIFQRAEADMLSRFPRPWESDSAEGLHDHYQARVKVVQDANHGLLKLRVETFRAEDSLALARALMQLAEEMVNAVNVRALADAVGFAEKEVAAAERRLVEAQVALTDFRNAALLVDPNKNSATTLDTIGVLSNELNQAMAEIQQLSRTAASSPALPVTQARAEALRARIASERSGLAGDSASLAAKVSAYERLALVRDIADKSLATALLSLEAARQEARRQQIYIERVSGPEAPEISTEPRRLRMMFTVFFVSMMAYAVFWILTVGAREHGQTPGGGA